MRTYRVLTSLSLTLIFVINDGCSQEFDHTHKLLDQVLKSHMSEGMVNYAALKKDRKGLDNYLRMTTAVSEAMFKRWGKDQQLAFYINVYNAETLQMIIDNYPVTSIKKIGSFFSGPWDQSVVGLFGKTITLNKLEHQIIRKQFSDARVHFALVCAAMGCPPLRNESFIADRLEEQLQDQGVQFLTQKAKNHVDVRGKTVYLSPIFKWYSEDFEKSAGSVLLFVRPFFSDADRKALLQPGFSISYTSYDWNLNETK